MGRVEEALRRSGRAEIGASTATASLDGDAFASPWSFRESPVALARGPVSEIESSVAIPASFDARAAEAFQTATRFSEKWLERLVIAPDADGLLVEQFRALAATLHQAQATANTRLLMVTSAEASEGKSLTAVNLALTLSESYGRRVLLIDGDLRRPSLHEITRVPNTVGLTETLKAPIEQKVPAFALSDRLTLVPAGQPDRNPMGMLTSARMRQILLDAVAHFDWVILDAPPIAPVADSTLLTPMTDGVLLVVRAGRTQYSTIRKAIDAIGRERILGVVLNGAETEALGYHRYCTYGEKPLPGDEA